MKFKKTKEGFYFFVNNKEIYKALVDQKWNNVIYLGDFKEENIQEFLDTGLGGLFLIYQNDNSYVEIYNKLKDEYSANVSRRGFATFLDGEANNLDDCIKMINGPKMHKFLNSVAANDGVKVFTDYTNLCGNCHKKLDKNEKYCRYCGTKRGLGDFKPFTNPMYCMYGTLTAYKYVCNKCGNIWTGSLMGEAVTQYCPECGTRIKSPKVEAYLIDYRLRHQNELKRKTSHEKIIEMALKEAEENK